MERSRRATNAAQYGLSKKQAARAARRAENGLKPKMVTVPGGDRTARADGLPQQAFRRDRLSAHYREQRARQAEYAASLAEHRRDRARTVAREIIAAHGPVLVVEDCDIHMWYRLWGKRLSQTTPGMLISALAVECDAAGGRLVRASTWSTALSQHCLCGERVNKTLRDRAHKCGACGLVGKRDLVSAAWPRSSASQMWTTPRPRTWTPPRPGTHRSHVHKRWKKRCGSQPHRARNRPGGRVAWQSHGNTVKPLLPEPPDGGTERPRMSHARVTTPESLVPAPAAVHSSPFGELRIKS
ncbi:hypothetical protein ACH4S9_06075 [Streptomyces sp. NPDC021225]|uniref:zinc ribbon domain-containing protein n=1 Tax=Streptomyces sp. NPDC021225 TaxID=3365121 RepID=UPI0037ABC60B